MSVGHNYGQGQWINRIGHSHIGQLVKITVNHYDHGHNGQSLGSRSQWTTKVKVTVAVIAQYGGIALFPITLKKMAHHYSG